MSRALDSRPTRRAFLAELGALGAALAVLGPAGVARAGGAATTRAGAAAALGAEGRATFAAVVEAVCSFDGRHAPPRRLRGRQPSPAEVAERFARDYGRQLKGYRETVDLLLPLFEDGPRAAGAFGPARGDDARAYDGRPLSELPIALRVRFLRRWLADRDRTPLEGGEALGIPDVGGLHRALGVAAVQLAGLFYYADRRTWGPIGYPGPWLRRDHEHEELPFSDCCHHHHGYRVDFGEVHG